MPALSCLGGDSRPGDLSVAAAPPGWARARARARHEGSLLTHPRRDLPSHGTPSLRKLSPIPRGELHGCPSVSDTFPPAPSSAHLGLGPEHRGRENKIASAGSRSLRFPRRCPVSCAGRPSAVPSLKAAEDVWGCLGCPMAGLVAGTGRWGGLRSAHSPARKKRPARKSSVFPRSTPMLRRTTVSPSTAKRKTRHPTLSSPQKASSRLQKYWIRIPGVKANALGSRAHTGLPWPAGGRLTWTFLCGGGTCHPEAGQSHADLLVKRGNS